MGWRGWPENARITIQKVKGKASMTDWIAQYWKEGLYLAIVTALSVAVRKGSKAVKKVKEKNCAMEKGIQALLRDRIIQAYNHYTDKGFCPIYAQENIEALYTEYHNLGGNGTITTLVEELRELPKVKKEVKL